MTRKEVMEGVVAYYGNHKNVEGELTIDEALAELKKIEYEEMLTVEEISKVVIITLFPIRYGLKAPSELGELIAQAIHQAQEKKRNRA